MKEKLKINREQALLAAGYCLGLSMSERKEINSTDKHHLMVCSLALGQILGAALCDELLEPGWDKEPPK